MISSSYITRMHTHIFVRKVFLKATENKILGADAFSSSVLGIGLVMNSFIPIGLEIKLKGMILIWIAFSLLIG